MTDCVTSMVDAWTTDLLAFARHAKRTMITCDDVRLLCRRNPTLLQHLDSRFPSKSEPSKRSRCEKNDTDKKSTTDTHTVEMSDIAS
ncbi:hypothetical protein M514_09563 [Trichuris suis]|uniref:Centromere protein S n=1 Tax=Trichuris suis TaxID=68888 RepID=A0A085LX42_9BILA|nr:hypothetical protein M513_09563 [Trichuris suis]KFD70307.1 hypothetical protein M514_09563 [Trichuris suis]